MNIKALLQDIAIYLALVIALRLSGATLQWYQMLIIFVFLAAFGFRNAHHAYKAGFKTGHDCGMSHKAPVHMQIMNKDEFDKIMAEVQKDFPVD